MTLTARDLMVTDVETVSPEDQISDVLARLAAADFTGFPVVDDDGTVVGIVTEHDLVSLFEPEDHTVWIPIGLPPFTETLPYAIDFSWDELDLGLDLVSNASKPVRTVMSEDVITVAPEDDLDHVLDLLVDADEDINRLPVVEDGRLVGIIARQDALRAIRDQRRAE